MFTIDYSFYTDTYGGTLIKESDFTRLSDRAIGITNGHVLIDLYAEYDISQELDNLLHKAVCAVAELISSATVGNSSALAPVVSQESVAGAWSKAYNNGGNTDNYSIFDYSVTHILLDYLGGTPLLFKGGFICG